MKKFLCVFLATMILFSPIFVIAASATSSNNKQANQDKITDELKSEMETKKNKDYISIYVWLYDLGDDAVYSHLSNKKGKEINQDNEESYIKENVKNKVEKYNKKQKDKKNSNQKLEVSVFKEESEISEILTEQEIKKCIDEGKTPEQVIELSEQYQYLSDFRDSRAYVNALVNDLFEKSLNKNRCKNVKIDPLLTYATMDCEKNYIYTLSSMDIVKEIGIINTDNEIEIQETILLEGSETEQTTNDKYIMQPPNVSNNSGGGIKVGVIESESYNPNATHIQGVNITNYTNDTVASNNHATKVLSILCGTSQTKDGIEYGGIAPDATIFFVSTDGKFPNYSMFQWLIVEKDVSIINMSFNISSKSRNYDIQDKYIDCLTQQYRVVFVNSAGNSNGVNSPGMAYNIITVGNVSNEKDSNNRYLVNSGSSYDEKSWLTNKPDVCAFGTSVYMLYNGEETNFGSGTSYSAPMVSGTIALMMAENNNLIGKPDAVKAILINTANSEIVSQDGNNSVYDDLNLATVSQMREKSGAGLLNIEGAVSMARSNLIHRYAIPRTSTLSNATKTTGEYYFEEGQVIEFTLVFEKPFDNKIESLNDVNIDFEIELYRYDDCIMSSESNVNNVECFKITIEESGYYFFKIKCDELNSATEDLFGDENGIFPHTSHNYFYVSFVLSCGCDLPSVEFDETYAHSKYGHNLKCGNCNSKFFEEHDYKSTTQHYDEVDVTYGVYYKVHPLSVSNSESYPVAVCVHRDDLTPTVETTNSENTAIAILNSSYIEYQNEKYWELLSYEIIVLSPTNETVASYISTVYVNIYYETGECNFDPSV